MEEWNFIQGPAQSAPLSETKVENIGAPANFLESFKNVREGLLVSEKDSDELYIASGYISIQEKIYYVNSTLTFSIGSLSVDTLYYMYVAPPSSGSILSASDFELSTTVPTYDNTYKYYYKTGTATKRLMAKYYQASLSVVETSTDSGDGSFGWASAYFNSSALLYMGCATGAYAFITAFRFPSVGIDKKTVMSAYLNLRPHSDTSYYSRVRIYGVDADDQAAPTDYTTINALVETTAYVDWEITASGPTPGKVLTSPNLATVVQEIIDRAGWANGNAIVFKVKDNSSLADTFNGIYNFDNLTNPGPTLTILMGVDDEYSIINNIDLTSYWALSTSYPLTSESVVVYDPDRLALKAIEKSTDSTFASPTNNSISTSLAVKDYIDSHINSLIPHTYYRTPTSLIYRVQDIPLKSLTTVAAWVSAGANSLGGWNLAGASTLEGQASVRSDWDGVSDLYLEIVFEVNIDNTGGSSSDTVDIRVVFYYKGNSDTATKTQTVEVPTTVGASARYKQFRFLMPIDYDYSGNVVDKGDLISFYLNLETDTSEVDDIVINRLSLVYLTSHVAIEINDL